MSINVIKSELSWNGDLPNGENKPSRIVLHHADASSCNVFDIHRWHLQRGYAGIGYHYFVRKDGTIYQGRQEDQRGAHCPSANYNSIGICFEGSYMIEVPPAAQLNAGLELIADIKNRYGNMPIYGHKDLYATSCPGDNFPLVSIKNSKVIAPVVSVPVQEVAKGDFTYPNNARIQGDWFYVRDKDGTIIPGRRVDDGDNITVLNVFYSKQLAEVEYPTTTGVRKGYITNNRLIKYYHPYNWTNNNSKINTHETPNGEVIGSLNPNEKATLLYMVGDWSHVVYTTSLGEFTKSGYVNI
ncbi:peptidoglycan recognition protein family protein [Clostridium sp. 'White wine YQ']|uniref:peptidoglycan recognition protein family protein n=1 Tax=Clostridium sp. 'White wine YQ' TaxID=3027474 RepID=UPI0023660B7A|nr:peptidoglycan recognition family protein [Clostridium sp. 'White wine YQ']MDD7793707.1 peptidoglycan recognition family protein [Clostridium sp. 'White wine YQ']